MSRILPQAINPVTRYFQWSGSKAKITWYNKEIAETVEVDFPFSFLYLDDFSTITGYSEPDRAGYYSNEVKNLKAEPLVVRVNGDVRAQGLYDQLGDVRSKGAKYGKAVYIAYRDEDKNLQIGKLMVTGSSLTAWIDLTKQCNINKVAVKVTGAKEAKKGTNTYYTPVFEPMEISDEANEEALKLGHELNEYLQTRTAPSVTTAQSIEDKAEEPAKEEKEGNAKEEEVKEEEDDDLAFAASNLPF